MQYLGERRRPGDAKPRLDRPPVEHWDRFFLPRVAQVEYRDGERSHLLATILHTPIHDMLTRAWFVQCIRLPLPKWLVRSYVARKVDQVLRQDRDALRVQTESIRRFGGERYASTELDLMGPEILRMLKQAERGLAVDEDAPERRVQASWRSRSGYCLRIGSSFVSRPSGFWIWSRWRPARVGGAAGRPGSPSSSQAGSVPPTQVIGRVERHRARRRSAPSRSAGCPAPGA